MAEEDKEEPKIFIDEDWKAQVEREREKAREQAEKEPGEAEGELKDELTEAGLSLFDYLVSTLAAQTMMALGLMAEEGQKQVMVDLGAARHLVDTLMMLREKTSGNLSEEESSNLTEAISELQRVYAVRAQQVREAQLKQPGIDPNPPGMKQ